MCLQEEYTTVAGLAGSEGELSQPLTPSIRTPQLHPRLHEPLHYTAELSSSLPYGLNTALAPHHMQQHQHASRLMQNSCSLPSSPRKLHPQSPIYGSDVYHAGSFSDVSCHLVEKTTTSRSKVLPKEVRPLTADMFIIIYPQELRVSNSLGNPGNLLE